MAHPMLKWLFPPTFKAQVFLGILCVVMFALLARTAVMIWPGSEDSSLWTIAAVFLGGAMFVSLWTVFGYFALLRGNRESENGKAG